MPERVDPLISGGVKLYVPPLLKGGSFACPGYWMRASYGWYGSLGDDDTNWCNHVYANGNRVTQKGWVR